MRNCSVLGILNIFIRVRQMTFNQVVEINQSELALAVWLLGGSRHFSGTIVCVMVEIVYF